MYDEYRYDILIYKHDAVMCTHMSPVACPKRADYASQLRHGDWRTLWVSHWAASLVTPAVQLWPWLPKLEQTHSRICHFPYLFEAFATPLLPGFHLLLSKITQFVSTLLQVLCQPVERGPGWSGTCRTHFWTHGGDGWRRAVAWGV